MKTNLSKKELGTRMKQLLEHIQEVGYAVGNPELNYMTDDYRNQYAEIERKMETLINDLDKL